MSPCFRKKLLFALFTGVSNKVSSSIILDNEVDNAFDELQIHAYYY
jgi:hypothetical protein